LGWGGFGGWGWGGWGWNPWWPSWGWGISWDPFWYNPFWYGLSWGWPYYGYSDYSAYPSFDYSAPNEFLSDSYNPNGGAFDTNPSAPVSQPSPDPNPVTNNVAQSTPTVLVYLKDGSMFTATDYWLADNQLHYYVNYGGESSVGMDQVDLQRTVDENAKRGVPFSLKPGPDRVSAAPAPVPTPAPQRKIA